MRCRWYFDAKAAGFQQRTDPAACGRTVLTLTHPKEETSMIHRPSLVAIAAALAWLPAAHAIDIDSPVPDYKIRLDLTLKYSSAWRLQDPSHALTGLDVATDPGTGNEDDGDHNFRKGLISSRFDLLGELDVTGPHFGGRVSGTAWHDSVYLRNNAYAGTPL